MPELTLNGAPVLRGRIDVPRVGVWHAELELDADTAPTGAATLEGPRLRLVGTVVDAARDEGTGRVTARVVGGRAGLAAAVAARQYRAAPLRVIVGDLARDAGETLAATSDADVLATTPPQWVRAAVPASDALAAVLAPTGAAWRVLADGSLWVGRETWPTLALPEDAAALRDDPVERVTDYRADTAPGGVWPGTLIDGRRASRVEHTITPEAAGLRVWWERTGIAPPDDRANDPLTAIVRAAMREVLYHALIPASVLAHDGDGTLQVQPEAAVFPPMVGVPLRPTLPGLDHRVAAGARVLIGFEGGDPSRPFALAFNPAPGLQTSATLEATAIKLGASATRGVARLHDSVDVGNLEIVGATVPGTPATGTLTITYTDGAGVPQPPVAIALAMPVTPITATLDLIGKVSSASGKVRAE